MSTKLNVSLLALALTLNSIATTAIAQSNNKNIFEKINSNSKPHQLISHNYDATTQKQSTVIGLEHSILDLAQQYQRIQITQVQRQIKENRNQIVKLFLAQISSLQLQKTEATNNLNRLQLKQAENINMIHKRTSNTGVYNNTTNQIPPPLPLVTETNKTENGPIQQKINDIKEKIATINDEIQIKCQQHLSDIKTIEQQKQLFKSPNASRGQLLHSTQTKRHRRQTFPPTTTARISCAQKRMRKKSDDCGPLLKKINELLQTQIKKLECIAPEHAFILSIKKAQIATQQEKQRLFDKEQPTGKDERTTENQKQNLRVQTLPEEMITEKQGNTNMHAIENNEPETPENIVHINHARHEANQKQNLRVQTSHEEMITEKQDNTNMQAIDNNEPVTPENIVHINQARPEANRAQHKMINIRPRQVVDNFHFSIGNQEHETQQNAIPDQGVQLALQRLRAAQQATKEQEARHAMEDLMRQQERQIEKKRIAQRVQQQRQQRDEYDRIRRQLEQKQDQLLAMRLSAMNTAIAIPEQQLAQEQQEYLQLRAPQRIALTRSEEELSKLRQKQTQILTDKSPNHFDFQISRYLIDKKHKAEQELRRQQIQDIESYQRVANQRRETSVLDARRQSEIDKQAEQPIRKQITELQRKLGLFTTENQM